MNMPFRVHHITTFALGLALAFLGATSVQAQQSTSGKLPTAFEDAGLDEQLGEFVAEDVVLHNEAGEEVTVGSYLESGRPVILNFVYYDCPMLCNLVLDGFTKALNEMAWVPGEEFEVLTVSFAAGETPEMAARHKAAYLQRLGRPEAEDGWHFLVGDEAEIQKLASSTGFQFKWDERQQEYAHPATLIFLSPEGRITRYLYGLEYPASDVRKALVEASEGTVGTTIDRLILYCFQYDPSAGSYVLHAQNAMKLGGLVTVVLLGMGLFVLWRRESSRPEKDPVLSDV